MDKLIESTEDLQQYLVNISCTDETTNQLVADILRMAEQLQVSDRQVSDTGVPVGRIMLSIPPSQQTCADCTLLRRELQSIRESFAQHAATVQIQEKRLESQEKKLETQSQMIEALQRDMQAVTVQQAIELINEHTTPRSTLFSAAELKEIAIEYVKKLGEIREKNR